MADTQSTLSEILAKSNPRQTLIEHSRDAVEHLLRFTTMFSSQIENVAKTAGISQEELSSRLFAAVWLHDIGKASRDFQARIKGESNALGIYHALLSTPFVLAAVPSMGSIPYEAAAVMSHHTPYYSGLYGDIETNLKACYLWDAAWEFYQMLPAEHHRLFGYDYPFPLLEPNQWNSRALVSVVRDAVSDYPPSKAREIFGLLIAAIHYGDWLSSGHRVGWIYTIPNLTKRVQGSLQKYKDAPKDTFASRVAPGIQSRAAAAKGHLLLIAPTGSGKTEAALLWASNQRPKRLIYLLPTRVTSNAMYNRVQEYVDDLAGLAHGTAGLVIGEKEGYDSEAFQSRLYHSTFMQPATIATVDQVLLSKFNWNQWGLVETNAMQSAIIFDEIHAYDLYTLGLILNAVRELAGRGTRLCFMSATMPDFIKEALIDLLIPLGGHTLVDCPEAKDEQRHCLFVQDKPLEDALPDIEYAFQQGKKVLVVANTVDNACSMYRLVRDRIGKAHAMLFHSRFIEQDRQSREKQIVEGNHKTDGFVAVVTQIVEVSLDIDYDVMFTQVAPVDALVQRFGRVNRKGQKRLVPVYVFQPDEGSAKVYGEDLLNQAWELFKSTKRGYTIRQADVLNWVKIQYPLSMWLQKTRQAAKEAEQNVRLIRQRLWQIQTLRFSDETEALWKLAQSRREQFPSFEIVPECFREQIEKCKHPVERQKYVVRVPAYLMRQKPYNHPELSMLLADVDYDSEFGVIT